MKTVELSKDEAHEILDATIERFQYRAKTQGYAKATKAAAALQMEFILGAICALEYISKSEKSLITPRILFGAMQGKYFDPDEDLPIQQDNLYIATGEDFNCWYHDTGNCMDQTKIPADLLENTEFFEFTFDPTKPIRDQVLNCLCEVDGYFGWTDISEEEYEFFTELKEQE